MSFWPDGTGRDTYIHRDPLQLKGLSKDTALKAFVAPDLNLYTQDGSVRSSTGKRLVSEPNDNLYPLDDHNSLSYGTIHSKNSKDMHYSGYTTKRTEHKQDNSVIVPGYGGHVPGLRDVFGKSAYSPTKEKIGTRHDGDLSQSLESVKKAGHHIVGYSGHVPACPSNLKALARKDE